MAIAAVRIRGTVLARQTVVDTLKMLRLTRANHCVILADSPSTRGMLRKVKDYVTWGEVTAQIIARVLLRRGHVAGDEGLSDAYIKAHSRYSSIWDFTQALSKGEASPRDVEGLKPVLRLHPPLKGYKSIKLPYGAGGDLGYRGKEIDNLLTRMLGVEK